MCDLCLRSPATAFIDLTACDGAEPRAGSVGAEPRAARVEESFAHASLTPEPCDSLYRAMVPCAVRADRLTSWTAPSHEKRSRMSLSDAMAKAKRTTVIPRRQRNERALVDWDKIVPSYQAAQRMAGPRAHGWAQAWIAEEQPQLLGDRTRVENFLRQIRRRLPTSKEYTAPSHDIATPGRNDNGTCFPTTKRSRRTRQWGAGGPGRTKCEELDEELFAWFVDSIQNVKGRIPSFLLLDAAQTFAEDFRRLHEEAIAQGRVPVHTWLELPALCGSAGYQYLQRWRAKYGITYRTVSLRYKCARSVLLERLLVFWSNVLRVRILHKRLVDLGAEPRGSQLRIEGFDPRSHCGSQRAVKRRPCILRAPRR